MCAMENNEWEYKIVDVDAKGKVLLDHKGNTGNRTWDSMNVLGAQGWELVQIARTGIAIFKRRATLTASAYARRCELRCAGLLIDEKQAREIQCFITEYLSFFRECEACFSPPTQLCKSDCPSRQSGRDG